MSIELDMFLILKKAEDYDEIAEQEKEYFGSTFEKIKNFMEEEGQHFRYQSQLEGAISNMGYHYGGGSWRVGVFIGNDFVMKLSCDPGGIKMNQREANLLFDVFPKVYAHCPNYSWILVEQARPYSPYHTEDFFPELMGMSLFDYFDYLDMNEEEAIQRYVDSRWGFARHVKPSDNLQRFIDFFNFYPQASYDMMTQNLGIVIRNGKETPVLVDGGLHGDISPRARGTKRKLKEQITGRR